MKRGQSTCPLFVYLMSNCPDTAFATPLFSGCQFYKSLCQKNITLAIYTLHLYLPKTLIKKYMIKKITIILFIVLISAVSFNAISSSSYPPTGRANDPSQSNCTVGCHSGTLITSGNDWKNIAMVMKSAKTGATKTGYQVDSTYLITLSYSQSGINKWGFEATILDASKNKAGSLSGSGRVANSTAGSRDYVFHTSSGNSSTGTNSTDWTFTWKAPASLSGDLTLYMCLNAANGDNNETGDQIYAKTFTIKPSGLPIADASCPDSVTCQGNTITMKGTSTGNPTSWNWVFTGSGVSPSASTSQNPQVKYSNAGNFWAILTTKNSIGSSKADSLKIVVKASPSSATSPNSGTYTFCKGDSLLLRATGSSSNSYTWSNGSVTQNIFAKDSGNYTVTAKSSNGCTSTSGIIKIKHYPSKTMSLIRDVTNDTICFERNIKVTALDSTLFDTILYYTSFGLFQKTTNNPQTFKLNTSTDLYAKGKDANGCLTPITNKFNFVVKKGIAAPIANCTDKTTASFEISWGAVTGALGYKISLDSGKTWNNPSSGATGLLHKVLGFPANTDVEVWLKAIDIFPCNESEITKVVCGSIPCSPLTYDIVWDKEVCKAGDINFKIKNLNSKMYSFRIDNGSPFKDTVFKITADFSRTYKFELTDSANLSCPTIKRDAAVKVWEIPSLVLTSSNAQNIFCEGSPAAFEVVSKGMQEYNFFLNTVSKQKSNVSTWSYASPKNLDSIWVTVTNGACVSTSGKIKLGVKPLPTAKFTHTFNGKTATFTPDETGTARFHWTFGDGNSDTSAKKPNHTYASGLTTVWVKLTVIDEFGCISTDSSEVQIPASVTNTFKEFGINVYPQPAKNSFKIEVPVELINARISLMDATGRIVAKTIADKQVTEIMASDLPNGVYMLMLMKDYNQFNGKVIINR